MEVLQTSALPLGYGALGEGCCRCTAIGRALTPGRSCCQFLFNSQPAPCAAALACHPQLAYESARAKNGAGNGIRTRDFDLGKVALYH